MRVANVIRIDAESMPDSCITCQELYIKSNTLACNLDGVDVLPIYKCEHYSRLRMYGTYKSEAVNIIPQTEPDMTINLQTS